MDPNKLEAARQRARIISDKIRARTDETVRNKILAYAGPLSWEKPEQFGIDMEAWRHVEETGAMPRLVFAHPDLLCMHPDASLHYRGIATLSRKRVGDIVSSVDRWEKEPGAVRVMEEKALRVARLYNAVISSIITGSTDWTLENGYRNILATIGITQDGALRNIIGQEAEQSVKDRIAEWLEGQSGIACQPNEARTTWYLGAGNALRMVYASEPDIRFEKEMPDGSWKEIATIEVKGGTDPAGALERLGAVKKSFDRTSARTRNFLIAGVVTNEMRNQLNNMHIEKVFLLAEILHLENEWTQFVNEIFHHTLRLLEMPYRSG